MSIVNKQLVAVTSIYRGIRNLTGRSTRDAACLARRKRAGERPMSRTVADQLADVLAVAGVRRIHGTAGDDLHWLVHAIRRRGRIHWLPVQHADVAAYAACNEARSTDELAVCAGSCGAGDPRLADA